MRLLAVVRVAKVCKRATVANAVVDAARVMRHKGLQL